MVEVSSSSSMCKRSAEHHRILCNTYLSSHSAQCWLLNIAGFNTRTWTSSIKGYTGTHNIEQLRLESQSVDFKAKELVVENDTRSVEHFIAAVVQGWAGSSRQNSCLSSVGLVFAYTSSSATKSSGLEGVPRVYGSTSVVSSLFLSQTTTSDGELTINICRSCYRWLGHRKGRHISKRWGGSNLWYFFSVMFWCKIYCESEEKHLCLDLV